MAKISEQLKFDQGDPAAFRHATNIDRRTCRREVPMRLLCLGCARTGTSSLRQALLELGYQDTYHFAAALQENPPDQKMWIEALEAKHLGRGKPFGKPDWDQLLGYCQAVTDNPCRIFYKELLEAYPGAKVILTVRDSEDQWFDSMMGTIVPFYQRFVRTPRTLKWRLIRFFIPRDRLLRFQELVMEACPGFQKLMYDGDNGTEFSKAWYLQYNEEIKRIVPKDRLLILNVKEGWKPLCEFLEADLPAKPFPRTNDMAMFARNQQLVGEMMQLTAYKNLMYIVMGFGFIIAIIGVWLARYQMLAHARSVVSISKPEDYLGL